MDKLQVLIVDDSVVYRKILTNAVSATKLGCPAQTASNGAIALERLSQAAYDVVLLDVNMPEMDGFETIGRIKEMYPGLPVIMISGAGGKNAQVTLKALEAGALDFILKPVDADYDTNLEIVKKQLDVLFDQIKFKKATQPMRQQTEIRLRETQAAQSAPSINKQPVKTRLTGVDVVVVASSTGGPVALEKLFERIHEDFAKPVLVVQHMPPDFTRVLAENMDKKSKLHVIEGKEDAAIRAGQVVIAPGGHHMTLYKGEHSIKHVKLMDTEYVNGVRPAADVLFRSVAEEYKGSRVLAVILTGMGSDGAAGVAALKKNCNCYTLCQNEESCVVYGMPRSVVEAGLADETVHLDDMARRIQEIAKNGS